jgi:hypothetical protein
MLTFAAAHGAVDVSVFDALSSNKLVHVRDVMNDVKNLSKLVTAGDTKHWHTDSSVCCHLHCIRGIFSLQLSPGAAPGAVNVSVFCALSSNKLLHVLGVKSDGKDM